MEVNAVGRGKNRRRKRLMRKQRREKIKFEVRSAKYCAYPSKVKNIFKAKGKSNHSNSKTMQADAFWKNYTAAQEWQRRYVLY